MHAIGGVNLQFRAAVFLHDFVHAGRTVPRFGRGVFAEVDAYRGLRIGELQVDGLVFLMADVGRKTADSNGQKSARRRVWDSLSAYSRRLFSGCRGRCRGA